MKNFREKGQERGRVSKKKNREAAKSEDGLVKKRNKQAEIAEAAGKRKKLGGAGRGHSKLLAYAKGEDPRWVKTPVTQRRMPSSWRQGSRFLRKGGNENLRGEEKGEKDWIHPRFDSRGSKSGKRDLQIEAQCRLDAVIGQLGGRCGREGMEKRGKEKGSEKGHEGETTGPPPLGQQRAQGNPV